MLLLLLFCFADLEKDFLSFVGVLYEYGLDDSGGLFKVVGWAFLESEVGDLGTLILSDDILLGLFMNCFQKLGTWPLEGETFSFFGPCFRALFGMMGKLLAFLLMFQYWRKKKEPPNQKAKSQRCEIGLS